MPTPLDGFTLPTSAITEYDAIAVWCARRGLTGAIGTRLPANISGDVMRAIDSDPDSFQERIRAIRYTMAMESHAE